MTDPREAARIIGGYVHAAKGFTYAMVGNGPYGLMTIFDDDTRFLSVIGFASASDAEVYAAFLRGQHDLKPPEPQPRIVMVGGMLGLAPPQEQRSVADFRVVALIEALPSDALAGLVL